MLNQLQSRKDQSSSTSKEALDQQQIEQIVTALLPTDQNQRTTEQLKQENRELKAFILGMTYNQSLGLAEIKQMLRKSEQDEVQRDQQLLRRVKFIQKVVLFTKRQVSKVKSMTKTIQQYTKPALYAALGTTVLGDLVVVEPGKEVVKKVFGEETFEAWANSIISLLKSVEPLYHLYVEGISTVFPMFTPKTATILLIAAALILNHTASIWQSTRDGLEKK